MNDGDSTEQTYLLGPMLHIYVSTQPQGRFPNHHYGNQGYRYRLPTSSTERRFFCFCSILGNPLYFQHCGCVLHLKAKQTLIIYEDSFGIALEKKLHPFLPLTSPWQTMHLDIRWMAILSQHLCSLWSPD